jgi:hypothetical protein
MNLGGRCAGETTDTFGQIPSLRCSIDPLESGHSRATFARRVTHARLRAAVNWSDLHRAPEFDVEIHPHSRYLLTVWSERLDIVPLYSRRLRSLGVCRLVGAGLRPPRKRDRPY